MPLVGRCSCGFETDKGNKFSAHFKYHTGEGHKRVGWVNTETGEISATPPSQRSKPSKPPTPKSAEDGKSPTKLAEDGKLAAVLTPQPAAVLFKFGSVEVPMEYDKMLEALAFYNDLKARTGVAESFCSALNDGMALLWHLLVGKPVIHDGKVQMEVKDGKIPGHGTEETGVGGPGQSH